MNRLPQKLPCVACLLGYPGPRAARGPAPRSRQAIGAASELPPPSREDRAGLQALIGEMARDGRLRGRGRVRRTRSTGAARPRCTCSSTCTATRATAARRWWTCCDRDEPRRPRAGPRRTARLPARDAGDSPPCRRRRWRADLLGELAHILNAIGEALARAAAAGLAPAGAAARAGEAVEPVQRWARVPPRRRAWTRPWAEPEPLVVARPQAARPCGASRLRPRSHGSQPVTFVPGATA
ncbi:MAG: hypothetical protein KatS3mg122_3297 [Caldimonas sp.]|nr:MAG: hypothetical protein KatS3mg122_3297 [Caldimonas sp.]